MSASGWSLPARAETRGLRLPLALLAPSRHAEGVWSGNGGRVLFSFKGPTKLGPI